MTKKPIEEFQARSDSSGGPESCHIWTGSFRSGYPVFWTGAKRFSATRWILGYQLGRPLGAAELACHHCDTPSCINVLHLYVGDAKSNMQDMTRRGRAKNQTSAVRADDECSKGHKFDDSNTYLRNGRRYCRTCGRTRAREYARRTRLHAAGGSR